MDALTRRGFLAGATAAGGLAALDFAPAPALAGHQPELAEPGFGGVTVFPDDPRYGDLVLGGNQRFQGRPDYVRVVGSTRQVVDAVQQAVSSGRKVAVRSGGHCYENFVCDPSVKVVIDLSEFNDVYYDPRMNAFAVEAGANLGTVYRKLYKGYGVSVPAGNCPTVGAGGHILGGGYGTLSRQFGLVVDHLHAVEVVVVDRTGRAHAVVASRDSRDARLRDLWWAHTGGGGGNFGVVTRYWLRSPGATGTDPSRLLPRPPSALIVSNAVWGWGELDAGSFARIVRNFCGWYERNSAPSSPYTRLTSQLKLLHRNAGVVELTTQIDATMPNAEGMLRAYYDVLTDGIGAHLQITEERTLPYWHASWWKGFNGGDSPLTLRYKAKSAYLRKGYQTHHIDALYKGLTSTDGANPATLAMLAGYGGQISAVGPTETASAARDSIIKVQYGTFWVDPAEDDRNITWLRRFYRDVHADTGGVPVPNEVTDGAFINYVDADLADPAWNTSGVPWQTLYYGRNYRRLQETKTHWDPRNVFNHALSIEPLQ